MRTHTNQDGITLLVTLLLMGVLLGVSASLLNVTLKQYQLSGIAHASEVAFQAAGAGMECALYRDMPVTGVGPFEVPNDGTEQSVQPTITCMNAGNQGAINSPNGTSDSDNDGKTVSRGEQRFQFSWKNTVPLGNPEVCTEVSVYKFSDATNPVDVVVNDVDLRPGVPCPQGSTCTVIQSRGYNVSCANITSGGRVVEREYTLVY